MAWQPAKQRALLWRTGWSHASDFLAAVITRLVLEAAKAKQTITGSTLDRSGRELVGRMEDLTPKVAGARTASLEL